MRKYLMLLVAMVMPALIWAEDYKILYLTTPSISIGGKTCKVGDSFRDDSDISWESPRQAMKVVSKSDGKQHLIVSGQFAKARAKSLKSYLVASKDLSTRRGELINTMELGLALTDTFYLLDEIEILTPIETDGTTKFFYATYDYNGEKINKKLAKDGQELIFGHDLFSIDGKTVDPFDVTLEVWYVDTEKNCRTLITDAMVIITL